MKFLQKYWPTITAILGAVLPQIIPGLQAIAAAYPKSTVSIMCLAIIAAYHATAPKDVNIVKQ